MTRRNQGLTIIEVIVALAILSIVLAAFSTSVVGSMKQNSSSGSRTGAVRFLDHLGRLVVEGDSNVLPTNSSTPRSWSYGSLDTLPELSNKGGFGDPNLYKAKVTAGTQPSWATSEGLALTAYTLEVCWKNSGKDTCVRATGVGPVLGSSSANPPVDVN
jgi:prepilin-type N-terminal cleavage/methylation domain-containing protein